MEFWRSQKNQKNEVKQNVSSINLDRPSYLETNEKEIQAVEEIRTRETSAQGTLQMKVVRPKKLSDMEAHEIADSLLGGQTIVLNLDEISDSDGRRLIDFIAGCIYAIRGKIERPADRTFLLTPHGVNVSTEDKETEDEE